MEPTIERFAALARSSPWRWRSLRFTVSWTGYSAEPVRAWIDRPYGLRVETLAGQPITSGQAVDPGPRTVLLMQVEEPDPAGRGMPLRYRDGPPSGGREIALTPACDTVPVLDADGLVAERPDGAGMVDFDDPMYENYRWVAMLDPAELVDAVRDPDTDPGTAGRPGTTIGPPRPVEHAGRPAWEAIVRPTAAYEPRCDCCPLFDDPAAAYRVRLDVGTGVCVLTEQLDGDGAGTGHDLRIEAVG